MPLTLEQLVDPSNIENRKEILIELKEVSYALSNSNPGGAKSKFSIKVGLPLAVSLNFDFDTSKRSDCTDFIRDIYTNYAIPYTLKEDIIRVFPGCGLSPILERSLSRQIQGKNLLDFASENMLENMDASKS